MSIMVSLPRFNADFGDDDFIQVQLSEMQSTAVPLVWVAGETVHGLGTAFVVSSLGILATARHVVDDGYRLGKKIGYGYLAFSYIGPPPVDGVEGYLNILVPIDKVARPHDEDIALLTGMRARFEDHDVVFPSLELDFDLPKPGDTLITLGYTRFEMTRSALASRMSFEMNASRGVVVDVYPERRDATAPFPCFSTTARVDAGMSGGPAVRVDPDGRCRVVGLNVSSYPLNETEDVPQHTSFLAATRCLLPLQAVGLDGPKASVRTVLELGLDGYLVSDEDFSRWTIETRDGRDYLSRAVSVDGPSTAS